MADVEVELEDPCAAEGFSGSIGLRVGGIFIILVSSTFATLMPIVTRRVPRMSVPTSVFDFAKYFGSGVIIATAFMHLLAPGVEALSSPCLNADFQVYTFAFAFSMIAMFVTFIVELLAFRMGSKIASRLAYDPHRGGHHHANEHDHVSPAIAAKHKEAELLNSSASHEAGGSPSGTLGKTGGSVAKDALPRADDLELADLDHDHMALSAAASEILGVAILEFGVIFHSLIIGITLATTSDFDILFIVIIFHQMFEGLGLGVRLSLLPVATRSFIPWLGGLVYSCVTPLGMAIGLGVRNTYNGNSATASYVTGIFDSVSSGILLYTGLVELLAHEFIFNEKMRKAPLSRVLLNIFEVLLGAGIMALLARWA